MQSYEHKEIEKKWQEAWERENIYKTPLQSKEKKKYYVLAEFTYPSGNLHVGHWYAFTGPDIYARYMRMKGYNVFYPNGYDAFGLPAENAAIERGLNPRIWTRGNIETMQKQFNTLGASFDSSSMLETCDPKYYKWTQWMFLKFKERGFAYQANTPVNWCPSCKTVLANEQVHQGHCDRCDNIVEQRAMKQWMMAITKYADKLYDDLNNLQWPESIKEAQRNWIGRTYGSRISFSISSSTKNENNTIDIFTTRADTLFGVTYIVLAPEHPYITKLIESNALENIIEVREYISATQKKSNLDRTSNKEKTGVQLKGIIAINPANGGEMSVWIADYVLADYGTGAVMAVPAHDERDFEFAKKYNLEIKNVISYINSSLDKNTAMIHDGVLVNSGEFSGMSSNEARTKITKHVNGKMTKMYRMRDWVLSRQRYWGTPIPIIHCSKCGAVSVPEKDLPVVLPDLDDFMPREDGKSPLSKATDWVNVMCPICGEKAERETDTMDTFIDSSWYFLRFLDPNNAETFSDKNIMEKWMPVDFYFGGAEHTTMHLLYSRFWHKVLFDIGLVGDNEPYLRRINRGLILGSDGNKMSKSKGNVIDPDEVVSKLGADTVRMYLAFMGPYGEVGNYPWDPNGVVGVRRFLEHVWRAYDILSKENIPATTKLLHKTIGHVERSITELKYNTAISGLMIFMNHIEKEKSITHDVYKTFLQLLAPFAPHITEELWRMFGETTSIHLSQWPVVDETLLHDDEVTIAVQVNGKVRGQIVVGVRELEKNVVDKAFNDVKVANFLEGKKVLKQIYVPGKIINFVV